ncbi:plasmid partitioning protein RepB C-terminal domain-containing protein [Roseateles sp.]|uniref:plasmid partitioning protein RepB C-terminal domain-containing protein n=1 Tax=Roseateles sp. TaxID=1971397 RepID=UPI0025D78B4A|nr:plasmid partitioning protein RepB C-terminal domain-containing protein [Roseateles sp.]MBV8036311.1 ParB N-terminal domain-containing protein [Roseateles sp.]
MKGKASRVEMIPIEAVRVENPRVRNTRLHKEITDNIGQIGLKRPITVRRLPVSDEGTKFALICGQGRLESCKALGQSHIAALVIDTDEETGHVMSLVENIARRTPRASEMLEQVGVLRSKGYSDAEIGKKIGCTASWVNHVGSLLERGERRLLTAAEAGHVPLHIAVQIARANDSEAQELLLEAYNRGDLKGRKVAVMRRILENRARSGKRHSPEIYGRGGSQYKRMTPEELTKLYQCNADEHRRIQKRAENTQSTLTVVQQIFKELLANAEFRKLLKAEGLTNMPKPLVDMAKKSGLV